MSFSSAVKDELFLLDTKKKCCMLAELAGIASFTLKITDTGGRFIVDSDRTGKRVSFLCKKVFGLKDGLLSPANTGRGGKCFSLYYEEKDADIILKGLKKTNSALKADFEISSEILKESCCVKSFVKGAFLGGGLMLEPEKTYHLEFVAKRAQAVEDLSSVLDFFDESPKIIKRQKYYVLYFKSFESIETVLNIIGAHKSLMEFMNIKIEKEEKNQINRMTNCEVANMQKTNDAASESIRDIEIIMTTIGLDAIDDQLQEMALLRLANPDESLAKLAVLSGLSRSGVNHRLKKISDIARELR
ncbi:MAG: DNA-binding protein WhiA [Bacillota bacterium]|nr:DNA-binding protein WhiA [Bacillota bacterium]